MAPMLELDDIHTSYGSIEALKGISITVEEGEVVTLIGSNGAGKSTTLRSISGLTPPRTGSIRFRGRGDLDDAGAGDRPRSGISQSPEGRRCFQRMTVRENLELGAYLRRDANVSERPGPRARPVPAPAGAREAEGGHDVRRRAADARDGPRADGRPGAAAARRAVDGARADPRGPHLRDGRARSTSRARRSCSWSRTPTTRSRSPPAATCWRPGKVVLADKSAALRENPEVQKAYLGT